MKCRHSGPVFVLRMDRGEELVSALQKFCCDNKICGGGVTAIGAVSEAEISVYVPEKKGYEDRTVKENCEILCLTGFVSVLDNSPHAHLHITLAGRDFRAFGGHLKRAIVNPTCELAVIPVGKLERVRDPASGLALLRMD